MHARQNISYTHSSMYFSCHRPDHQGPRINLTGYFRKSFLDSPTLESTTLIQNTLISSLFIHPRIAAHATFYHENVLEFFFYLIFLLSNYTPQIMDRIKHIFHLNFVYTINRIKVILRTLNDEIDGKRWASFLFDTFNIELKAEQKDITIDSR